MQKVDPSVEAFFPTMIFVPAHVRIEEVDTKSNVRIALKIEEFLFFMFLIFCRFYQYICLVNSETFPQLSFTTTLSVWF